MRVAESRERRSHGRKSAMGKASYLGFASRPCGISRHTLDVLSHPKRIDMILS